MTSKVRLEGGYVFYLSLPVFVTLSCDVALELRAAMLKATCPDTTMLESLFEELVWRSLTSSRPHPRLNPALANPCLNCSFMRHLGGSIG